MSAKRKSAFNAATTTNRRSYTQVMKEAQQDGETVEPKDGEEVEPLHGETVTQQHSDTVEQLKSEAVKPLEGEAALQQDGEAVERLHSDTATQQDSSAARPLHRLTVKKEEKISFYLTHEQANKLDDLAHEHRKRTGKRVNRNDIVRHLVDQCDIGSLANMSP